MFDPRDTVSAITFDGADLQFSEGLLASILGSSPDAIMVFVAERGKDGAIRDFKCQLANPEAEEVTGKSGDELLGHSLKEQIPHFAQDGLFDAYVTVVESGRLLQREQWIDEKHSGWLHMSAFKCADGFVLMCRDITNRKAAERAVRESEHRFRMLAENMTDLVCLHDLEGKFLYVSPSSRRILGYAPFELVGEDSYQIVHPEDVERVRMGAHRQVLSNATFSKVTYRVRCKDGTYTWVESTTKPIRNSDGDVYQMLTSSRDITDRVRAEKALERTNEELKRRNRELQDFAYVASHDLQEPLRKVRAFADLMREDYADNVDEMGQYYLERMQDAARRMSSLISDLLTFSRVTTQGHPFEPVDLEQIAQEVKSDLEIQIRDTDGAVHIDSLPTLEADPMQMRQLLQNLISNGLKFHRPDVPPEVTVTAEPPEEDAAADDTSAMHAIYVRDNGIGFKEKYADRIFTPFQRLHGRGEYEGTGMGLAICRRIVERHQGNMDVRSTPGEGTTFIIQLPLQPTPTTGEANSNESP